MRIFLFLFFSVFVFYSCEPGGPGSKSYKDPSGIKEDIREEYKVITKEGFYSIEIPSQIDESSELNDNAQLQYISEEHQFGVLVLNENINDSKKGMNRLNPKLEESNIGDQFIDKYIQFQINTLKSVVTEYDYFLVKQISISQRDARTFEITARSKDDPTRLVVTGTVVEGRSQVYYIYMFYPAEKQEDYRPIKDHILESFTLNETSYEVESEGEVYDEEIISEEEEEEVYEETEEVDEVEYEEEYEDYSTGIKPKQSSKTRRKR